MRDSRLHVLPCRAVTHDRAGVFATRNYHIIRYPVSEDTVLVQTCVRFDPLETHSPLGIMRRSTYSREPLG